MKCEYCLKEITEGGIIKIADTDLMYHESCYNKNWTEELLSRNYLQKQEHE